ncbi:MAG: protein kinase [Deltaproteobacteria bacterium]|nr:protein kinase [Deltaproteobacteria bacterium]
MEQRQFTDTSNVFSIDYGDVILVNGKRFQVTGHERERRFGIEDPKFWVKKVLDLETGEKKIIKLSFFETFELLLGGVKINCFRNPKKEGDILNTVRGHPHFMQGWSCPDSQGNILRILDIVQGPNFLTYLGSLDMNHETYFQKTFPNILEHLFRAFDAIRFLHVKGFKHGDIRNDHIIVEQGTGNYVWIDFDYDFITNENPYGLDIIGLGNILLYAAGKGFHTKRDIDGEVTLYGDLRERINPGDFSIINRRRFVNLKKLYPYIPDSLNDMLIHFSMGTEVYYESVQEIIDDLNRYMDRY